MIKGRISVITTYRDREAHLKAFLHVMPRYLPGAEIIVIEQADKLPFNAGALRNIGALNASGSYYALHDIDHTPLRADYSNPGKQVIQLVKSFRQPENYIGGATLISADVYALVGGFSNHFWGWGGEDNELFNQLQRHQIPLINRFGDFTILDHPRPPKEFDPVKWEQAQKPRAINDGLNFVRFNLISKEILDGVLWVKVGLIKPK